VLATNVLQVDQEERVFFNVLFFYLNWSRI
jgi:hypothetical protein